MDFSVLLWAARMHAVRTYVRHAEREGWPERARTYARRLTDLIEYGPWLW